MPAEVMKQPSGIAPIRVTRPSLKLSPSDSDLNVRFATVAHSIDLLFRRCFGFVQCKGQIAIAPISF